MHQLLQVNEETNKIKSDARKLKEALQGKMARSHVEFTSLQERIMEKKEELNSIKSRLAVFVEEDCKSQAVSQQRARELEVQVKRIQHQVTVARREHEQLTQFNAEKQKGHDTLVLQVKQEQELWER
jgi:hypothetical protein